MTVMLKELQYGYGVIFNSIIHTFNYLKQIDIVDLSLEEEVVNGEHFSS